MVASEGLKLRSVVDKAGRVVVQAKVDFQVMTLSRARACMSHRSLGSGRPQRRGHGVAGRAGVPETPCLGRRVEGSSHIETWVGFEAGQEPLCGSGNHNGSSPSSETLEGDSITSA
jgi:hypothetical protein